MIHDTCYASGKVIRDKVFYPPIHHHLIRKFYDHFFSGKQAAGVARALTP